MFENPRRGRQARNFITNVPKILDLKTSSAQIFSEKWRWVRLKKKAIEILAFASLVYLLDLLVCHTRQCLRYTANHRGHVAHVTFKSLIIGENKQHLKRGPQELLVDMNNLKHSLNIPPVLFRTEQCANQQSLVVHKPCRGGKCPNKRPGRLFQAGAFNR